MARIRTIKPEAFNSESLAAVSLAAERTFFGLLTQSDDHGRFRDQPAVIAGLLWSLRPEHGPLGVEDDLTQLHAAELICRYQGDNGKRYLHIVTFAQHQKVNRPSGVRHPACPHHDLGIPHEPSRVAHGALTEPSAPTHDGVTKEPGSDEHTGQDRFNEPSSPTRGGLTEAAPSAHGPDLGSRNRDLGSTPLGGASAPAPQTVSAKDLIAEYTAASSHRPPDSVLGHLGSEIKKLLNEGIDPDHLRVALARHRAKGMHPSTLPSLVNEAMNAAPTTPGTAHRSWTNPADVTAAYGGDL
ncbi:hypothetical protein [Streptomyces sp. NPDC055299]